jgi:hypothetical protein
MAFGEIGSGLFFFITKLELLITEIGITECHRAHNGFVATQTMPKSENVINDIVPMESLARRIVRPGNVLAVM